MSLRQGLLGKTHPDYGSTLNNLSLLYKEMNNYILAESMHLQEIQIAKNKFGEEHINYAASLDNLGALYYTIGNYVKTEPLYLKAQQIRKNNLGEEHVDYTFSLNNLGLLHQKNRKLSCCRISLPKMYFYP